MAHISVRLPSGVEGMDVEEYVKGVLPNEMASGWPIEALKAQAVIAKSYAVAKRGILEVTTADQVYNSRRFVDTNAAAEAVRGVFLGYRGAVIMPFFFAACGGNTLRPSDAGWSRSANRDFLQSVQCDCGKPRDGHGIGMCQRGAEKMARGGATYEQILRHYYTGAELVDEQGQPLQPSPADTIEPHAVMQTYMVQTGDTLLTIAARFECEWSAIFVANTGVIHDPNLLDVGCELKIPSTVVPKPVLGSGPAVTTYVVAPGDSLSKLARLWGCTVAQIVARNAIADQNRIKIGQVIVRP